MANTLSSVNQLTELTSYIDHEIKDKLSSNDYLNIMTKLNNLYKSINKENKKITNTSSQFNINFEWSAIVYNYINKYNINRILFLSSKFNLLPHINSNRIINCSCNRNFTNHNCSGNIINCKYSQQLLLDFPLLLFPFLIDKYDLNTLCDSFNIFYRIKKKQKLVRNKHSTYYATYFPINVTENNKNNFINSYFILIKLKTMFITSDLYSNDTKYLISNIINLIIMKYICNKYYIIKKNKNLAFMIKNCKQHLDNYYINKQSNQNDLFEQFMHKVYLYPKTIKYLHKKFTRLTNKYFY